MQRCRSRRSHRPRTNATSHLFASLVVNSKALQHQHPLANHQRVYTIVNHSDKEDLQVQLEQSSTAHQTLETRIRALEKLVFHHRSSGASSTSSSVDLTQPFESPPSAGETIPDDMMAALQFHRLKAVKPHPRFPGIFSLADPETDEVMYGSSLPATLTSDFRTILTGIISKNRFKSRSQLRQLQRLSTAKRCLILHLTKASRTPSVWTKDF